MIDDKLLKILNDKMIDEDVPIYQRPMAVALEISQIEKGVVFPLEQLMAEITSFYKKMYSPEDLYMPPVQVGGVGLRDKFYKVRISVVFGRCSVNMVRCIDITQRELEFIHAQDPSAITRAAYTVADLWDFAYGVNDLKDRVLQADVLWEKARSSIEETARLLSDGHLIDSAVQPICLSAELSIKGTLSFLGVEEKKLKQLSHNIQQLANALSELKPSPSDDLFQEAASQFPDYVKSRYSVHALKRADINRLAMLSEYVAADAIRRISDRNIIEQILEGSKRQIP